MAGREGEKERERESAKIYNMQTVGYCSQSHLEWKASFGEECRRDGLLWLQMTKSSNVKRTEITDWTQRELDF